MVALRKGSLDLGLQVRGGSPKTTHSWGSHSLGMSHIHSGESNARGDNLGSKTRKTSKKQTSQKGEKREELPLLQVDGPSIQRSGSQSSLLSVQSAGSYGSTASAFSNATADAVMVDHEQWEQIMP